MTTAAPQDDDEHTLLSLPREIRDMIYEYVCADTEVKIRAIARKFGSTKDRANIRLKAKRTNTALMRVCKQTYAEFPAIYYQYTPFKFSGPIACATWVKRYVPVKLLGKVKHLRVRDPGPNPEIERVKKGFSRYSLPQWVAEMIKHSACATLGAVALEMDAVTMGKLSPGALQIEVITESCDVVWASDPEECKAPKGKLLLGARG